jgi:RNase P subunit RPR2
MRITTKRQQPPCNIEESQLTPYGERQIPPVFHPNRPPSYRASVTQFTPLRALILTEANAQHTKRSHLQHNANHLSRHGHNSRYIVETSHHVSKKSPVCRYLAQSGKRSKCSGCKSVGLANGNAHKRGEADARIVRVLHLLHRKPRCALPLDLRSETPRVGRRSPALPNRSGWTCILPRLGRVRWVGCTAGLAWWAEKLWRRSGLVASLAPEALARVLSVLRSCG